MYWLYQGSEIKDIEQFPEGVIGFIYKITRVSDGKYYIGKKSLYSERNKPLTKKELADYKAPGKKPKKKKVISESDWKTYHGSHQVLKEEVKKTGGEGFVREILFLCTSKKQLTYQEIRHQILNNWESDQCWNDQILGKFWKKDA